MNIIAYLNEGSGLLIMIAGAFLFFALIAFLVLRSSLREYAGRVLFPVFFIELALFFLVMAVNLPYEEDGVGPTVVPSLWIVGILGLSVYLLIRALRKLEEKDSPWGRVDIVALYIGMVVLYLILMNIIGYFIATLLFIVLGIRLLDYRNWKVIVPLAAGWILFSYFAFYRLLYVPLPQGSIIQMIFG